MILSVLVNVLWQGALIVAAAYLVLAIASRANASTRCAVWYATLVALLLLPLVAAAFDPASFLQRLSVHSAGLRYSIALTPIRSYVGYAGDWFSAWTPWILAAWLAGAAFHFARLGVSLWRVRQIRRDATPVAGEPGVCLSARIGVPVVVGIFRPSIVIPRRLAPALSAGDLRLVIAHERAHIRRNDPLLNLLQRFVEALLFFNPWVRLAGARVSIEREAACDDWAVDRTGSADQYARCLAALAEIVHSGRRLLLTPSVFGSRRALIARIDRLTSGEPLRLGINAYAFGGVMMIFAALTLLLGIVSPALALPTGGSWGRSGAASALTVAASCANPNVEARVLSAAPPALPHGLHAKGTVNVAVTIGSNGHVLHTTVVRSSGNAAIDSAVVAAAKGSTYTPKIVNCVPAQGGYLFHVDFAPGP